MLHTGETVLSAPLTAATGLSAVEEITEGGLTDSRTSTANWLSISAPPSDNELGLLPPRDRKDLEAIKDSKGIFGRLRGVMVSDRLVSRLSVPWSALVPTPPAVKVQVKPSEKPSAAQYPRPRNKLRKKTRPSIAITLAVEPASSFSLAQPQDTTPQPLPRSLDTLQTNANSISVPSAIGFPSAKSFLSFQLPPVFSRARSKLLQKSTYRPSNDVGAANRPKTTNRPDADSSGLRSGRSGGRVWWDNQQSVDNSERTVPVDGNGVGGFPTPTRSAGYHGRRGRSGEGPPAHGQPSRASTRWELGLGLGQDLGRRVCRFCRVRGG